MERKNFPGVFTAIRPYTGRFSEKENPTVRFCAVLRKRDLTVRFGEVSDIVNPTVRFGAVIYRTVRFGAAPRSTIVSTVRLHSP